LVSVVAENRKPCPPTKKKTTSNQIKEKLELEFPMCPIGALRQSVFLYVTCVETIHGPSER